MPKGIFLIGWDNTIGPQVEAKYPPEITIETDRMLHYLMIIQTLGTTPIVQVQDESESALIYGIPSSKRESGPGFNYNFIVLILKEDEVEKVGQFKFQLSSAGKKIVSETTKHRIKSFGDFARSLLEPPSHKIVFIGFANAGKTSTKKFFFEKMHEEQLLSTTIEPTLGFETNYYNLIDLNLSLFDTAGQELDRWYEEDESVLDGADFIVFFFSVEDWNENTEKVKNYLFKLVELKQKRSGNRKNLIVFCHKFDLIKEQEANFKKGVLIALQSSKIPLFFTSLVNGGNIDLIEGMQLLLLNFSRIIIDFNNLINPILKRFKLAPLFLIDSNNRILASYIKENGYPVIPQVETKKFVSSVIIKYAQIFKKNLEFSTIWLQDTKTFITCVSFTIIHEELAYLWCLSDSLKYIAEFFDAYQELIKSFAWDTVQS